MKRHLALDACSVHASLVLSLCGCLVATWVVGCSSRPHPTGRLASGIATGQGTRRENVPDEIARLRQEIRNRPDEASNYADLAQLFVSKGNLEEAIAGYVKASKLAQQASRGREFSPLYSLEAARLYEKQGNAQQAECWYEKSLSLLWAYRVEWIESGMDRRNRQGDFGRAVERRGWAGIKRVRKPLAQNRPDRQWILRELPFLEFPDSRRDQSARDRVAVLRQRLWSGKEAGPEPNLRAGMGYLACGRADEAVVHLLAAAELNPRSSVTMDELGWAYLMQGRLKDASGALAKADALGSSGSAQLAARIRQAATRWDARALRAE